MFEKINFLPGNVTYNDFNINPNIPLENQIFSLKEDLFQANYANKYLIDIGWGPEFDAKGKFKVRIIKDFDWINPIYFKKTKNPARLYKYVEECVKMINSILE